MGRPDGKLAKPGKKVVVKYRGTLANGKMFDESKKPFAFRLGKHYMHMMAFGLRLALHAALATHGQHGLTLHRLSWRFQLLVTFVCRLPLHCSAEAAGKCK